MLVSGIGVCHYITTLCVCVCVVVVDDETVGRTIFIYPLLDFFNLTHISPPPPRLLSSQFLMCAIFTQQKMNMYI